MELLRLESARGPAWLLRLRLSRERVRLHDATEDVHAYQRILASIEAALWTARDRRLIHEQNIRRLHAELVARGVIEETPQCPT